MTALEKLQEAWQNAGLMWQDRGDGTASAQAPDHSPADRSVTFRQIEGRVLMNSFADDKETILAKLDLATRDLFDETSGVTYTYGDGRIVHRSPAKKFRQSGNTAGTALFRVEKLQTHVGPVYVVEGEQDVLAVESVGGVAVSSPMGAGKAHLFDWSPLAGRTVIVVADDDKPGMRHADDICKILQEIAADITVVTAAAGKDAADHIAAGHGLDEFVPVPESGPKLWRATDLKAASQMNWLAAKRIPMNSISLLVGAEGIGKSLLWVLLAAAVTRGRALREFGIPERDPQNVLVVVTEDDWAATVRPRLELAGADLSKIIVICEDQDGSGAPTFPQHLYLVERALRRHRPALIVVDAWVDTIAAGLKVSNPQDARQALHPWREIATAGECAVLLLTHTNREKSGNARDTYGLTGELRKKARMSLLAQVDDDGNLSVGPEKSNLVGNVPAALFRIEAKQVFAPTEDDDGTVPQLVYVGDDKRTAREIHTDAFAGENADEHDEIDKWLLAYLANGPVKATEIYSSADAAGFSKDQAKRAKKRLNILAEKSSGSGPWMWTVPELSTSFDVDQAFTAFSGDTKGAELSPVPPSRSLAPLQVTDAPLGADETKGADEGDKGGGRSLDRENAARAAVLGALSLSFGLQSKVIAQSVPKDYRDQTGEILAELVEEGIAVVDHDGKYLKRADAA